jgi:predicted PurR-regulated permease PerM
VEERIGRESSVAAVILYPMLDRWVYFRVRTVLGVLVLAIAVFAVLKVVMIARDAFVWLFIALFLALALNPLVEWLQRRGIHRRSLAVATSFVLVIAAIAGIGFLFVPTLVNQVNDFVQKLPDYIHDLTHGRGKLGFLETKYHIVEKVRKAIREGGASRLLGLSGVAIEITKSVIKLVVATITITFMTFFMLLEGPAWVERLYGLLPERSQPRWRAVGHDVYRTVGGYVSGNLVISVIAGGLTTIVLLIMGVPYAIALGLIVAFLDLIPLAGATIAAIIVGTVAFIHSIPAGIVVIVFFIVYQQIENHFLQPVVYGRTVQLSPLVVLFSVLVGAAVAGIIGALAAIPVAGAIQVLVRDWLRHRREALVVTPASVEPPPPG